MASNKFNLRVMTPNGTFNLENDVNGDTTVKELKTVLSLKSSIPWFKIKILCGYPPRALEKEANDVKLKDLNILSGETIRIERMSNTDVPRISDPSNKTAFKNIFDDNIDVGFQANAMNRAAIKRTIDEVSAKFFKTVHKTQFKEEQEIKQEPQDVKIKQEPQDVKIKQEPQDVKIKQEPQDVKIKQEPQDVKIKQEPQDVKIKQEPQDVKIKQENVENKSSVINTGEAYDDISSDIMMRHVVPSNNSCLFSSIYFAISDGNVNPGEIKKLRGIVSRAISGNPERFSTAVLGKPNSDYCEWIEGETSWGGGIEMAILSEHYKKEIVVFDTKTLGILRFGENSNYANRIFLMYDGIHYDPLTLELANGTMKTTFSVKDDRAMQMALEIAREAQSSKQFTDLKNFTLKCLICNEHLCGEKEAREHAVKTKHVQFGEINE